MRPDFPSLRTGSDIYVDNAATTQMPQQVIAALQHWYGKEHANVYRGLYARAERATASLEGVRSQVAAWIGADPSEIVFNSGATEGINTVALGWAQHQLRAGDEIVVTELEHHANLLPWYELAKKIGLKVHTIPVVDDTLRFDIAHLPAIITAKTKLVALTSSSNLIGTPDREAMKQIIARTKRVGARLLLDAAQYVAHQQLSLGDADPDFLVFSGHKIFAPTGVGVLYIHQRIHQQMKPVYVGGGMVYDARDLEHARWLPMPRMLEAGTPNIGSIIGLGAAVNYIRTHIAYDALQHHEAALTAVALEHLEKIPGIRIFGDITFLREKGHMLTFAFDGIHAHDIAAACAVQGVALRAGHHCCQALHHKLGISSSVRISFAGYNTREEAARVAHVIAEAVAQLRAYSL